MHATDYLPIAGDIVLGDELADDIESRKLEPGNSTRALLDARLGSGLRSATNGLEYRYEVKEDTMRPIFPERKLKRGGKRAGQYLHASRALSITTSLSPTTSSRKARVR